MKISDERDPRDSKPLIKIDTPSSQLLVLKANSQTDFKMWYNSLYFSAMNAHAKRKFEDFDRVVGRLEQDNERADKKDLLSILCGIEGMLKYPESRAVLFDELEQSKPEYRYLGDLHNMLQEFKLQVEVGQHKEAAEKAKMIHNMLTQFSISGVQKEDTKGDFSREDMMEDMQNKYLEVDVQQLMKSVADSSLAAKLAAAIVAAEQDPSSVACIGAEVIRNIEQGLVKRIKEISDEAHRSPQSRSSGDSLKLLTIPVTRFKQSIRWSAPSILHEMGVERGRITKAATAAFSHLSPEENKSWSTSKSLTRVTISEPYRSDTMMETGRMRKQASDCEGAPRRRLEFEDTEPATYHGSTLLDM